MMYIVSYDITSDRLRNKVAKTIENYGKRIQYSVFECELTKSRYKKMYSELCKLMADSPDGDIRIFSICERCQEKLQIIGIPKDNMLLNKEEVIII